MLADTSTGSPAAYPFCAAIAAKPGMRASGRSRLANTVRRMPNIHELVTTAQDAAGGEIELLEPVLLAVHSADPIADIGNVRLGGAERFANAARALPHATVVSLDR